METIKLLLFALSLILAYETAGPAIAFKEYINKLNKNKRLRKQRAKLISWLTALLSCSLCTGFWLAIATYYAYAYIPKGIVFGFIVYGIAFAINYLIPEKKYKI